MRASVHTKDCNESRHAVEAALCSSFTGDKLSPGPAIHCFPCLQFGVFLEGVEQFDSEAFGIMRSEAVTMDPQQRLLLHATHAALVAAAGAGAGAGGDGPLGAAAAVAGRCVGAFVGIAATDYDPLSQHYGVPISSFSFTAASPSVAAGRLSYVFGLRGQNASVDTACSASLVATHLACAGLRHGPMDAALAAGVLLCLVPQSTLMLQRAGMLSPEGRSKTLDASADGYVRGETCRSVYLSPLALLGAEAPLALGLVLGSAVNTNGRASSLTAPNGPSQQALLREALAGAGLAAGAVDGLQMHSNGTSLGDPIEVGAASAALLVSGRAQQNRHRTGTTSTACSLGFCASMLYLCCRCLSLPANS